MSEVVISEENIPTTARIDDTCCQVTARIDDTCCQVTARIDDTCCICIDQIIAAEHGYLKTKCCNHLIHSSCFITYAVKNKRHPNKCPMCRKDINTGQEYTVSSLSEYDAESDSDEYEEYEEYYDEEYGFDSYTDDEPEEEVDESVAYATWIRNSVNMPIRQHKPDVVCTVSLDTLKPYSDTGNAVYKSDTWFCQAQYNSRNTKLEMLSTTDNSTYTRSFVCGDMPRLVSINVTPNNMPYVIIVYPDDGECHKVLFYFPVENAVIMGAFLDRSCPIDTGYCDNLSIILFSNPTRRAKQLNYVYLGDGESSNLFTVEVVEIGRLYTLFNI